MTIRLWGMTLTAMLATSPAYADTIEGTWRVDLGSVSAPTKPSERLLKDGVFTCNSCTPKMIVNADGAYHPATGDAYSDEQMARVVDDHVVELGWRKGGKQVATNLSTISPDGKTMTVDGSDLTAPDGKPIKSSYSFSRMTPQPAGTHAISGSWRREKITVPDAANLLYSWKMTDGKLVFVGPGGIGYAATVGGPAVPVTGDIGGTTVKVIKLAPGKFREMDYRQGKLVEIDTYTVSADGKSLTSLSDNKERGRTSTSTAYRQ